MARLPLLLALALLCLSVGAAPAAAGTWAWPVRGEVITSYRNGDDPYARGQHRGIDIAAPVGRAVAAPTSGRVTYAGTAGSSGLTVSMRTADGRWDTSYLHLSSLSVRKGDEVRVGGRLGAVGTSGRRSSPRPHLHFGVREAKSRHAYHDPLGFLAPLGGSRRSQPGPVGAPLAVPLKPRPGAARVPAARRAPAPAGSRVPAPAGAPGRAPAPALASSAVGRALAPGALGPAPALRETRPEPAERTVPQPGPERSPAARPRESKAPAPATTGTVPAPVPAGGGFDLGWALACLGVAVAAVALGRPGHDRGPRGRLGTAALRVFGEWVSTSRPRSTT